MQESPSVRRAELLYLCLMLAVEDDKHERSLPVNFSYQIHGLSCYVLLRYDVDQPNVANIPPDVLHAVPSECKQQVIDLAGWR